MNLITLKILQKFASSIGPLSKFNKQRQFVFSSSTAPTRLIEYLTELFPQLEVVRSKEAHKISPSITIENINANHVDDNYESLLNCIVPNEPTMIFCDKKSRIDKVCEFLMQKNIVNLPYSDSSKMTS